MGVRLTETQEALRALVREFAERELRPGALERHRMTLRDAEVFRGTWCGRVGIRKAQNDFRRVLKVDRGRAVA